MEMWQEDVAAFSTQKYQGRNSSEKKPYRFVYLGSASLFHTSMRVIYLNPFPSFLTSSKMKHILIKSHRSPKHHITEEEYWWLRQSRRNRDG